MTLTDRFHISQGLDVLTPKSGNAYPIPCDEWKFLKGKLQQISAGGWSYQDTASLLAGVALSTFVTILTDKLPPSSPQSQARVIAWSVVAVSTICSSVCFFFAREKKKLRSTHVIDVITQMELIEHRYEVEEDTGSPPLTILSARYGSGESYCDVTDTLMKRLEKPGLHIRVDNDLVPADPSPGDLKELVVEYELNGQRHSKKVVQREMLSIP